MYFPPLLTPIVGISPHPLYWLRGWGIFLMYRSEYDKTGRASRKGAEAEIAFKKAMDSFFGSNIEYTDEDNGQFDHIDFRCSLGMTVDVKSIKDPETIWIEIKNIKGYDGWLYGDCTHFAFERESFFFLF